MKKAIHTIFISAGILFSTVAVAQFDLEILDPDSNVITSNTYTVYGLPSTSTLNGRVHAKNEGAGPISMVVKRYETDVMPGTENFLGCMGAAFAGVYPELTDPFSPFAIQPGAMQWTGLYYRPNGLSGVSCFHFVFFNEFDPSDSTWVNICFDTESVGLQEHDPSVICEVFPNPSKGALNLSIAFRDQPSNATLTIHDQQGRQVWAKELAGSKEKVILNDGDLGSGIYTYRILDDSQIHHSGRFIITD